MRQKGICYIVGARPLEPELIPRPAPGDLLVAADAGLTVLEGLGLVPDLVVGDFDSLGAVPEGRSILRLPRVKDETDMGFALNHALELGYRRFILLGGLGGRLEHTVANLQLLSGLSSREALGVLAGEGQAAAAITGGGLDFPAGLSGFCSVFALTDQAGGVTLEGLKYPLEDETLTSRFPLGVSNEFLGLPARISVREGTLLIIWETRGRFYDLLPAVFEREDGP